MKRQKTIIIGGGIGGLTVAIALNRKGIESSVFERADSSEANGAGLALWANATQILSEFGLLDQLLPLGSVLSDIATSTSKGRPLSTVRLSKLEDLFHFPSLVLLRSDLQQALLQAISVSQIRYGKLCTGVEQRADIVEVFFADGTAEMADAVIFADGIHSWARTTMFHLPPLKYAGRTSWRGVAQFDQPVLGRFNYEIFGTGKRIGIFPLPGNTAYWYAAVNMPEQEAFQQKRTTEGVLAHFKDWCEPVQALIKSTPEARLALTNIHYTPHIRKMAHQNMALLGDAAHPMTPDLGQGACQAIEDAYVLAECLSQNQSVASAFLGYEAKRLGRVKSIAANSFRMGRLRQMGNPVGAALRNGLLRLMPESAALRTLAWNIRPSPRLLPTFAP